jgi:hypothetical protein
MPKSQKDLLREHAITLGLYVTYHSPGDGVTRYRFFKGKTPRSYFSGDGIYTALGIAEAKTFLRGRAVRR